MTVQFDFFFFNDTAPTEIYTLSLHDALPIYGADAVTVNPYLGSDSLEPFLKHADKDRKSTRLNSSHGYISYAVFCLKKKKQMSRILAVYRTMCTLVIRVR